MTDSIRVTTRRLAAARLLARPRLKAKLTKILAGVHAVLTVSEVSDLMLLLR